MMPFPVWFHVPSVVFLLPLEGLPRNLEGPPYPLEGLLTPPEGLSLWKDCPLETLTTGKTIPLWKDNLLSCKRTTLPYPTSTNQNVIFQIIWLIFEKTNFQLLNVFYEWRWTLVPV